MGNETKISWCDATFNPWSGCSKVSEACRFCYAESLPPGMRRHAEWGDRPRVMASDSYWNQPLSWNKKAISEGKRIKVFCGSTMDVFEDRDDLVEGRRRLWELIEETKEGINWLLLTKRTKTMLAWSRTYWWPINAWAGATMENQACFDERIGDLLQVKAPVRFVSCEPLLSYLNISAGLYTQAPRGEPDEPAENGGLWRGPCCLGDKGISWVIVGGESGKNARPMNPMWVRDLRDQAVRAGVPFHFKQWGEWGPREPGDGMPFNSLGADNKDRIVALDGTVHCTKEPAGDMAFPMSRVGKHVAGKVLDGRTWDETP